jgi:hypothetical protein
MVSGSRRGVGSVVVVAVLVGLLIASAGTGDAQSFRQQRSASAAAVPVSIAVDGREHEVIAAGAITRQDVPQTRHLRVVLQNLTEKHGRWLWATRSSGRVADHGRVLKYLLRWARPPTNRPLMLRTVVLLGKHLLARSAATQVTAGDPGTVFYSGEGDAGAGDVGDNTTRLVASFGFLGLGPHFDGKWTGSHPCETSNAVTARASIGSEPITELAGFSLGRLGPIYFLRQRPAWISQISYILLLDPGTASEMTECEPRSQIAPAGALASWLASRTSNRLVIMAGPATLADNYSGLDRYYLRGLQATEQRQVLICHTGSPSHDAFLENQLGGYGWMVSAPVPTTCPHGTSERSGWRSPLPPGSPSPPPPSPTAPPTAPPSNLPAGEFAVMNASGGIYWRSSSDWNTPEATPGNGFYPGTVVAVSCYERGTANVPGSADEMWEQATWVSGPGSGDGWINEHFVDDAAPINQPSPGIGPCTAPSPSPPPPPPETWLEQETPNHPVNTFTNYHNASGMGPAIAAGQWVEVSCKVYDPTIVSVNPDGYWYRIASSPWSNSYYSPANTFMNGDPYGGPYTHNTDFSVPNC